MSEKVIHIHKFQDGNEAVVVEFGFGKIGIGLDSRRKGDRQLHRSSENLQTKNLFSKRKDEARITERKFKEAK